MDFMQTLRSFHTVFPLSRVGSMGLAIFFDIQTCVLEIKPWLPLSDRGAPVSPPYSSGWLLFTRPTPPLLSFSVTKLSFPSAFGLLRSNDAFL